MFKYIVLTVVLCLASTAYVQAAGPGDVDLDDWDMDVLSKPPKSRCNTNTTVEVGDEIRFIMEGKFIDPITGEGILFESDYMPDDERRGYHGDAKHRHFLRLRFYNETDGIFPGLEHLLHGMCLHEVRTATIPSKWGFGRKGYKFKRTRYPCYPNKNMGGRVLCKDVPPNCDLEIKVEVQTITKHAAIERKFFLEKLVRDKQAERDAFFDTGRVPTLTSMTPVRIPAKTWTKLWFEGEMLSDRSDLVAFTPDGDCESPDSIQQASQGDYEVMKFWGKHWLPAGEYTLCFKPANRFHRTPEGSQFIHLPEFRLTVVDEAKTDL